MNIKKDLNNIKKINEGNETRLDQYEKYERQKKLTKKEDEFLLEKDNIANNELNAKNKYVDYNETKDNNDTAQFINQQKNIINKKKEQNKKRNLDKDLKNLGELNSNLKDQLKQNTNNLSYGGFNNSELYSNNKESTYNNLFINKVFYDFNNNYDDNTKLDPMNFTKKNDLDFYWYNIVEDYTNNSNIYLFGKVKHNNKYFNSSLKVSNIKRNIYFILNENSSLEDLKKEIFKKIYIKSDKSKEYIFKLKDKKYCFELDIKKDENFNVKTVKLSYPFSYPLIKVDYSGEHYNSVIGLSYTPTELFMLKKKWMGPCWLIINAFTQNIKLDTINLEIESKNHIETNVNNQDNPKFNIMFLSLDYKVSTNNKKKETTINNINIIQMTGFEITSQRYDNVKYQSLVYSDQDDENNNLLSKEITNSNYNGSHYSIKEFGFISHFLNKFTKFNPDIVISHDLYSNFFDKIINKMMDTNNKNFNLLGRLDLKLGNINKILKQSYLRKINGLLNGRLLLDTFSGIKEHIKLNDYTINSLQNEYLKIDHSYFKNEHNLDPFEKLDNCFKKNYVTMKSCLKLNLLPLSKQLTIISGCNWQISLSNKRSERNEMLLMHSFYSKNFIIPDRSNFFKNYDDEDKKKNKKTTYKGGLVIEPKKGLYTNYVILVDFNSLYPSIIRNFKLCFTTVDRMKIKNPYIQNEEEENNEDALPVHDYENITESKENCILPHVIKTLIDRRKQVKNLMNGAKNEEAYNNFDIRQKAFKLIANSIYGCLGFKSSRFYARTIASHITNYGRNLLQNSKNLIDNQKNFNLEVIYGDTDSLMIDTKQNDLKTAIKIGYDIKNYINKGFKSKIIEIDLDGVFKTLLLLKKKKYVAAKINNFSDFINKSDISNITPQITKELKGIDLVRRDWSQITKIIGNKIVDIILNSDIDNLEFKIMEEIKDFKTKLDNNDFAYSDFIIYRVLNKNVNEYSENNYPHVFVAKKLINKYKYTNDMLLNHAIPYIICKNPNNPDDKKLSYSQRAYHLIELTGQQDTEYSPVPDLNYYIDNQIYNPVQRLLENIEVIDLEKIKKELGVKNANRKNLGDVIYSSNLENKLFYKYFNTKNIDFKLKCPINHEHEIIIENVKDKIYCKECLDDNTIELSNSISVQIRSYLKKLIFDLYQNKMKCNCSNLDLFNKNVNLSNKCSLDHNYKAMVKIDELNTKIHHLRDIFDKTSYINDIQFLLENSCYENISLNLFSSIINKV